MPVSSPSDDCSELRSEVYGILQGLATPDVIAMNSGSQPDWSRVITQECAVSPEVQLSGSFSAVFRTGCNVLGLFYTETDVSVCRV